QRWLARRTGRDRNQTARIGRLLTRSCGSLRYTGEDDLPSFAEKTGMVSRAVGEMDLSAATDGTPPVPAQSARGRIPRWTWALPAGYSEGVVLARARGSQNNGSPPERVSPARKKPRRTRRVSLILPSAGGPRPAWSLLDVPDDVAPEVCAPAGAESLSL